MKSNNSLSWVSIMTASLLGWNIGLLTTFLMAIGVGVVSNMFQAPITSKLGISSVLIVSVFVGIVLGIYSGRKTVGWFQNLNKTKCLICFVLLIVITLLSFPTPFVYII
jgi:ABC-type dipeptide/oligopeptide/nickel transport system permease component